jgi:Ca2+-transporting ATPase
MANEPIASREFPPAISNNNEAWHTQHVDAVAGKLDVRPDAGLSADEAAKRAASYGANELRERSVRSVWRMLLDQFADFMILALIAAAVISGILGDLKDTIAIAVIVLLNAVIGFLQELRAEKAILALKQMAVTNAIVLRAGERVTIPAKEIVPGDIVLLEAGNVVPASSRTISPGTISLAGMVTRSPARKTMAFKGTIATYGRGTGIAVATGMATELGKIATLLDTGMKLKTPLQQRLSRFGRHLALAVLAICVIVFVVGLSRGEKALLMFLTAVSLAVAAIPEALPAIVSISLALGARKMVARHALIRNLPAVETLGSVTYICTDKTGTLTENRMRVEEIYTDGASTRDWRDTLKEGHWDSLFTALALSNDASRSRDGQTTGDPTEVALYLVALESGYDKAVMEEKAKRVFELPFDSDRKRMTTFHRQDGNTVAFTKGAPESVLPLCTAAAAAQGEAAIDKDSILAAVDRMAAEGLRVIAIARRKWDATPQQQDKESIEKELVFLGLLGMMDPPRAEAKEAVSLCKSAGIVPVMITGDHAATALAIARQVGVASDTDSVVTGPELAAMDDQTLRKRVMDIRVYARVDPAQKIRIVEALQNQGQFVAMTGDGVNDAPALKRADIGIAMGKGGTDVAREASSLVLLDDNFATIVSAIREGRHIFDNILKFIRYTMTSNSAEIWVIFLAPFLGLPIPLLPIHILWINLLTDGLPGLAMAAEPEEKGIMQRPPRAPNESIFANGMWQHIVVIGLVIGGVSLFAQAWAIRSQSAHWQTMVFTVLTLAQMAQAMAIRSDRESLFTQGLFSNLPLLGAVLLTFLLQMATIYVPWMNTIFNTEPLTAQELFFCLMLSLVVFFAVEVQKWMIRAGLIFNRKNA